MHLRVVRSRLSMDTLLTLSTTSFKTFSSLTDREDHLSRCGCYSVYSAGASASTRVRHAVHREAQQRARPRSVHKNALKDHLRYVHASSPRLLCDCHDVILTGTQSKDSASATTFRQDRGRVAELALLERRCRDGGASKTRLNSSHLPRGRQATLSSVFPSFLSIAVAIFILGSSSASKTNLKLTDDGIEHMSNKLKHRFKSIYSLVHVLAF